MKPINTRVLGLYAVSVRGWAHVLHGHLGGQPSAPDLPAEQRLAGLLAAAASAGLLAGAHDLSDGGLAAVLPALFG